MQALLPLLKVLFTFVATGVPRLQRHACKDTYEDVYGSCCALPQVGSTAGHTCTDEADSNLTQSFLPHRKGCFILVDIYRLPGESLAEYHERQQHEVTSRWTALSTEEAPRPDRPHAPGQRPQALSTTSAQLASPLQPGWLHRLQID